MRDLVICDPCCGGGFTGNSGKLEDDVCEYCGGIGSLTKEQATKVNKCSYCDEIVDEIKHTLIIVDISTGAKICEECWNMTRDDIKGTYGRDVGPWAIN